MLDSIPPWSLVVMMLLAPLALVVITAMLTGYSVRMSLDKKAGKSEKAD